MIVRVAHTLKQEALRWIADHGASILSRASYPQNHEYEYKIDCDIPLMAGMRIAPGPEAARARAQLGHIIARLRDKYGRDIIGYNAYNSPRRRWVDASIEAPDMDMLIDTLIAAEFIASADALELRRR